MADLTSRCDASASGAENGAYSWVHPDGWELVLCGHHGDLHADQLYKEGWHARR